MSERIQTAVVLAAGLGNRIAAVGSTPKPLLSLSGVPGETTFLDFHLRQLADAGVEHVVFVGNERTFETPLQAITNGEQASRMPRVSWVKNPTLDLSTSGSAHSLQFAWHSALGLLDGKHRVLFMDADIVYGPRTLATLSNATANRSLTLVAPRVAQDSEEVVVFAEPQARTRAVRHGKGLHGSPLVAGLVPVGEATGMVLVAADDHALLRAATDWAIGYSTAKARSEHEDVTQLLMGCARIDVVTLPSDEPFIEVDTPADYERLTTELWPLLRERKGD
jgi:choline kinase